MHISKQSINHKSILINKSSNVKREVKIVNSLSNWNSTNNWDICDKTIFGSSDNGWVAIRQSIESYFCDENKHI